VSKRPKTRTHPWVKESEILNNKLNKIGNIKQLENFTGIEILKRTQSKQNFTMKTNLKKQKTILSYVLIIQNCPLVFSGY